MTEPIFFGIPISLAFLYFIVYSVLGWCMETVYCSILERRFVPRGFLFGPMCPIYGVGVLMMVCWFQPLMDRPVLFYLTATVCMSAWEYFVGWFLETTTHIKYWDYSMYRFNLQGRICLWVCLTWGVLAYVVIFWIHPFVSGLLALIPLTALYIADMVMAGVLVIDIAVTIQQLTLITKVLTKLSAVSEELRLQMTLGKAELTDRLDAAKEKLKGTAKLHGPSDTVDALRLKYNELLAKAERQSRHLRYVYRDMSSRRWSDTLEQVKRSGLDLRARLREAKADRKNDANTHSEKKA